MKTQKILSAMAVALGATAMFGAAQASGGSGSYDVAAFVWPAYHPEPRWAELGIFKAGKGEWQNVWEAVPKWVGHRQPLKPLWGYENEADPKVVARKIDAAVAHGVNVFIYDWYWYGGRPFLEDALDKGFLGAPNNGKMKFFIMWANHDVNNGWDNTVAEKSYTDFIWRGTVSMDEFRALVSRWINLYFKRPNYYRIQGKPVLMVYDVPNFVKGLGGVENAAEAVRYLRTACADAGLGGAHFMACDYGLKPNVAKAVGIDSATIYNLVHWASPKGNPDYAVWAKAAARRFNVALNELKPAAFFAHASVGWDQNPRYPPGKAVPTVLDSTPAKFEVALRRAKDWTDRNVPPGLPKLVTINSWNEWTEGSYLEPDQHFGFGYLEAIRRVFCPETAAGLTAAMAFSGECARFDFDEANGACTLDAVHGLGAVLAGGARWAQGSFGTALATGVRGAAAEVDAVPGIDGGDAATLFLRFRREGRGSGKYPSLLTSDAWSGVGGTLFFSTGPNLAVRLRADGTEASWTAFANMPTGRWTSVAVTFKRPDVTVYADGVPVKKGKWNHPFLLGRTHLGAWGMDSFDGLIDDFRVWNEALPPERIAAIASEAPWKGAGGAERYASAKGVPVLVLDGTASSLTLDSTACILSLREKATGRELVEEPTSFARVELEDGRVRLARRLVRTGENRFACAFQSGAGTAEFSVKPFPGGWTFAVERLDVPGARTLAFARVTPSCSKWKGGFANAWSDEQSAVAVRAAQLAGEPSFRGGALAVWVDAARAKGQRALLAAGPRDGFRTQLQEMTKAAGVPQSDCGGAWSMGSEQSRRSYVFASILDGDIDYWIDLARRSGFSIIHINDYSWSGLLGPYPINPKAFPGGIDEMKRAADRVHAAGLQMGIHSLTGCINPRADWIHPVCDTNLVADYVYTLAQPLAPDATELVVEELPGPKHSTVFTYSSNGNVLQIGGELLQYTGIRREKPYAFTGLTRGAFKTTKLAGTIPAGTRVNYLHQRYIAFYPNPDSPLAEKLASRLAEVYNFCGLDDFYFDGSEGMGTRYGIDAMRHKIFAKFARNNGHSASVEASCGGANNWWFQTRMATVDHPVWGAKRFHDWHITWAVDNGRNANFLEPQMGWWAPRVGMPMARGHFPDDMEYFAGKNAGHDAAMSVQGITARPLPVGIRRQLAILGWYEHARLARAFTDEAKAYLATPETEARLRQDAAGNWQLTDVEVLVHRAGLPWTRAWTVDGGAARRPAALRVEALYAPGAESTGHTLAGADAFAKMQTASAGGVSIAFDPACTDAAHGRTFKLSATNTSAPRNGAWARARLAFDFPGLDIGAKRTVFGAWVKGDGSGALLNLQLTSPGEYHGGTAEHYVRLDFTGWKHVKFLLRERDSATFCRYRWPYGGYAAIYRSNVSVNHIASFSAYLNDVPAGKSASVEIGEVSAWEMAKATLTDAAVTVNGEKFAVPFALASGEYAELEDGAWTKYAESGTALARVATTKVPTLAPGQNACSFTGGTQFIASANPGGTRPVASEPRAEVTFFALGKTRPAFKPLTAQMRKSLRVEALAPFEYAPQQGLAGPSVVPVRPGEKASLVVEVQGPVAKPTFTFNQTAYTFDETLATDESLVCRDGRTWKVVVTATGKARRTGTLSAPLPTLSGSTPFAFSGEVPADKSCVVEILKEYSSL